MPSLGLALTLDNYLKSGISPWNVTGNVLSLVANRPTPTSGTMSPWKDNGKFGNNATLSNFAGSATSGWVQEWIPSQTGVEYTLVDAGGGSWSVPGASPAPSAGEITRLVAWATAKYGTLTSYTFRMARRWMIRLDGSDDFLSLVNSASLDLGTSDFAIAITMRMLTMGTGKRIISKRVSGAAGYEIQTSDSNQSCVGMYLGDGTNAKFGQIGSDAVLSQYNYATHLFVFKRNSTVTHYLNKTYTGASASISTVTGSINNTSQSIIGKSSLASTAFANMDVANISIYKGVFDINQILKAEWQIARDYIA